MTTYTTQGGEISVLFLDMLSQPHLLIAGASGSGKSTLLNGIICTALHQLPNAAQLILIDPKRTELNEYAHTPHALIHATEPDEIPIALEYALQLIEGRYKAMQTATERIYSGGHVYIIIDELADLMTTQKKRITPLLQRIAQIGRAARVHLIAATQCPLAKIIPTEIKVNFTALAGLHTLSRQHSRNIIDCTGCELLPLFGECLYSTPQGLSRHIVPYTTPEEIAATVAHWAAQAPPPRPRRRWWQRIA